MHPNRVPALLALALALPCPGAELRSSAIPGTELASRLWAKQEGTTYIRVRMETCGSAAAILQLQIKSRVTRARTDLVYQVLFPRERKGEAVLLHRTGTAISGTVFHPPDTTRSLTSSQLAGSLFGTALSYEDAIVSFFSWKQQAIVGHETVDRIECRILESRPGKGQPSSYSRVRSWVDADRLIPLRIEKYDRADRLARRIAATRILRDGDDSIPIDLSVRRPDGTVTLVGGSRIRRGIELADPEFTPEGLKQLAPPRAAPTAISETPQDRASAADR